MMNKEELIAAFLEFTNIQQEVEDTKINTDIDMNSSLGLEYVYLDQRYNTKKINKAQYNFIKDLMFEDYKLQIKRMR
jgi:hypothetical protein